MTVKGVDLISFGVRRHASFMPPCVALSGWALSIGVAFALTLRIAHAQDAIKIGVAVPLSGNYGSAGIDIVDGAELAVRQINAAGGVLGKKLALVSQDDACDADKAANAAKQLVAARVTAMAGGYCSSAALAELRVSHAAGIPSVLDASTAPGLTDDGWNDVFRTIGRADAQGQLVSGLMKALLHVKRAAVINDGTTYSQGLAEHLVAALKQDGIAVVYDGALTPGQPSYHDIAEAAADKAPDALYFTGYFTEAAVLAKDLRQLKPQIQYFMGGGTADPSLIEKGGSAVEGMIVTTSPLPQYLKTSSAQRFLKGYEKAYGRAPGPYSVYEYDAVGVTAQAIANAKSDKPTDVAAALHALRNYHGATGEIAFDRKGDRAKAAYMAVVVRHGRFEPYAQLDAKGRWVPMK